MSSQDVEVRLLDAIRRAVKEQRLAPVWTAIDLEDCLRGQGFAELFTRESSLCRSAREAPGTMLHSANLYRKGADLIFSPQPSGQEPFLVVGVGDAACLNFCLTESWPLPPDALVGITRSEDSILHCNAWTALAWGAYIESQLPPWGRPRTPTAIRLLRSHRLAPWLAAFIDAFEHDPERAGQNILNHLRDPSNTWTLPWMRLGQRLGAAYVLVRNNLDDTDPKQLVQSQGRALMHLEVAAQFVFEMLPDYDTANAGGHPLFAIRAALAASKKAVIANAFLPAEVGDLIEAALLFLAYRVPEEKPNEGTSP